MREFYTEKETEAFLQDETRILILPDGRKESVTTMSLTWQLFDRLEATKAYTKQELIKWAYDWYRQEGRYDFTTYFWNLVAFTYDKMKDYCDDFIDRQIKHRERVLESLQDMARNDFNRACGCNEA